VQWGAGGTRPLADSVERHALFFPWNHVGFSLDEILVLRLLIGRRLFNSLLQ
jgi:hypothetical protein